MNPDLACLKPYPFVRLAELKAGITPPADREHIALSIGEPRHDPPSFVIDALRREVSELGSYPVALGLPELRETIAQWLNRRYALPDGMLDPATMVLPLNGTREGLFAIAQAVVERADAPAVLMPNPFYQIYEGAALLAGAEPVYMNTTAENGYLPDLDAVPASMWKRCQLLYLCSPGNPTGAVMDTDYLARVIELAERYDFVIASDECYAEIYFDQPPPGLLQVCRELGRDDFARCIVFHSLSKRSNVPGMRSGFCAGDASIMKPFLQYRTYHGCAVPNPTQRASIAAWSDDRHVEANRALYREKFDAVLEILGPELDVRAPDAAFYLWPQVGIDDETFAARLYAEQNVTVLPGSYLARDTAGGNPGAGHVRISLVAGVRECIDAAERIRAFARTL